MAKNISRNAIKDSKSDKVLYLVSGTLLLLFTITVIYPLIYIVSCSFSSAHAVNSGRVVLLPVDFSLTGYEAVFNYKRVLTGYGNTIFYTVFGTVLNLIITLMTAYPLAMPGFQFKKGYSFLFTFTMFFSGGLVPAYLLNSSLGLVNSPWVMLIPGMLSVYNMIVTRTFIQNSIPVELLEASQIDGCSWFGYFFKIVLPLSKAVIAVITLYYAVGHWNAYFNAMIYLNDRHLHPLQLVLREILVENSIEALDVATEDAQASLAELLKYALIIVSTVPILCVYPFVQKYFMKGVMIGSVKG